VAGSARERDGKSRQVKRTSTAKSAKKRRDAQTRTTFLQGLYH
jgi:hypothetical protein